MRDELPDVRASDSDRERTVEVLRSAAADGRLTADELEERVSAAYAARTTRELDQLTADVSPGRAPAGHDSGLAVKEGPGGDSWVISIMGGHDKRGRWRVAPRCTVLNLMGGSDIDLNDAELSEQVTEINVYSLMGGSEIWVPHGVEVHVSNFGFMGGSEVNRGRRLSRREKRELRKAERRRKFGH